MIRGGLVTLPVRDLHRAVRFYVEVLGVKLVEFTEGAHAMLDVGADLQVELVVRDEGTAAAGVELGLRVKLPLEEAANVLENRGIAMDRTDGPHGPIARFEDPDGHALYLVSS